MGVEVAPVWESVASVIVSGKFLNLTFKPACVS